MQHTCNLRLALDASTSSPEPCGVFLKLRSMTRQFVLLPNSPLTCTSALFVVSRLWQLCQRLYLYQSKETHHKHKVLGLFRWLGCSTTVTAQVIQHTSLSIQVGRRCRCWQARVMQEDMP